MKALFASIAVLLFAVVCAACGKAGDSVGSASTASSFTKRPAGSLAAVGSSIAPALRGLRGDEDDDDNGENIGNTNSDNDSDFDNDYKDRNLGYYDSDDGSALDYGHAASAAQQRTLRALVERYYAAATAADGTRACPMIVSPLAGSIVEDYGQGAGPAYLRGAKTCAAVMSRFFKHIHSRLAAGFEVTGVRVAGNEGLVFLGSKGVPASEVLVEHQGGAWRVGSMFGSPLP